MASYINEYFAYGNSTVGGISSFDQDSSGTNITRSYYDGTGNLLFYKDGTLAVDTTNYLFYYPFSQLKLKSSSVVMLKTNVGTFTDVSVNLTNESVTNYSTNFNYWLEPTGGNQINDGGVVDDIADLLSAEYIDFSYQWAEMDATGTNIVTNTSTTKGEWIALQGFNIDEGTNFMLANETSFSASINSVNSEFSNMKSNSEYEDKFILYSCCFRYKFLILF